MRALLFVLVVTVLGCGGQPPPLQERPRSWSERMAEAERHEQRAALHASAADRAESGPPMLSCEDPVVNDQLTSGTERLTTWSPCWPIEHETEVRHRRAMERELAEARKDRRIAARLLTAERNHCAGLPEAERARSPFAHRAAIRAVTPYREDGEVRGARIVFRPVRGLTAPWLRQAIACQQARFALLGEPARYHADDPTLVDGARVSVEERAGAIEVIVVTDDPAAGQVAAGRAQDLLAPRSARR